MESWRYSNGDVLYHNGFRYTFESVKIKGKMYRGWEVRLEDPCLHKPVLEPTFRGYDVLFGVRTFERYEESEIDLHRVRTDNMVVMSEMFMGSRLRSIDISEFNTDKLKIAQSIFGDCRHLTNVNIGKLNLIEAKSLTKMFRYCNNLEEVDLSSIKLDVCTSMSYTFQRCGKLKKLALPRNKVTGLRNIIEAFCGCSSLKTIILDNFYTDGEARGSLFEYIPNLEYLDIRHINVRKQDIDSLFCIPTNILITCDNNIIQYVKNKDSKVKIIKASNNEQIKNIKRKAALMNIKICIQFDEQR